MTSLYRLVYTSFRKPVCNEEEIQNILAACKRNNPGRGVTGILLHSSSRFIQYMEGTQQNVQELYELIKKDTRHTSINRRSFEPIPDRIFPSWEMGYKDMETESLELHTEALPEDKEKFVGLLNADLDFDNDGLRVLQLFFRS